MQKWHYNWIYKTWHFDDTFITTLRNIVNNVNTVYSTCGKRKRKRIHCDITLFLKNHLCQMFAIRVHAYTAPVVFINSLPSATCLSADVHSQLIARFSGVLMSLALQIFSPEISSIKDYKCVGYKCHVLCYILISIVDKHCL